MQARRLKIAFLGNFSAPWCSEVHESSSFELLGHQITRIQEGDTKAVDVPRLVAGHDLFCWVQTYGLAVTGGSIEERSQMLEGIRSQGIPSIGLHLDRWWCLERSDQLETEPFFRVDHLFTADGGHQEEFKALGINHHWFPPGVYAPECVIGEPRDEYKSPVGFVGSYKHYHEAWRHRRLLIRFLTTNFDGRLGLWPRGGQVRGKDLSDLYASVQVLVGDSCLVGSPGSYVSDRVPETLGRGGFLIHPEVPGVTDGTLWQSGEHLVTWKLGDWDELRDKIHYYLDHHEERERIRKAGYEWTRSHHTYTHRLRDVLETLERERAWG